MPAFDEDTALRHILNGTAGETGALFFRALVSNLATAFDTDFAWITEFLPETQTLKALAFYQDGEFADGFEYALHGTPCEPVIQGKSIVHHPSEVQSHYPEDPDLQELGMVSYLGIPLLANDGAVLGHMAIMDRKTMPEEPRGVDVFRIFAARATAELNRLRAEKVITDQQREQARLSRQLQQAVDDLAVSEGRFRDLFDEAPIAYVNEGLDSRFIRANKTALKILGIAPGEAEGFLGRSLVPEKSDAQQRVTDALDTINRGLDADSVVLELRRHDNGAPVWVQWWSKPDPSGEFTRTMFVDITDRVLLEQENSALQKHNAYLQEELDREAPRGIVGGSAAMRSVLADIEQVATTDASVLILGETGTGKEVAARAVHEASARAGNPLIKVNCGALPESLIESELFGHEKGAFTGATTKREGRFSLADGGTIFLDEIGDLPFQLQVKLLRVLQEGEFEPLGSATTRRVDVRVIAATNRDLFELVQDGEFREDLYYRLAVFPIHLPPLRERLEDLPDLASAFAREFARRLNKAVEPFSEEELSQLAGYAWPGNIRELQNVIERALITSDSGRLNLHRALPASPASLPGDGVKTASEIEQIERENVLRALQQSGWKISGEAGAAELLGVKPTTLTSRLKALNIKRP